MTVTNVSANKISTIPRQCHPAAIAKMVMGGLRCLLGDATLSEHAEGRACSYILYIHIYKHEAIRIPKSENNIGVQVFGHTHH